MAGILLCLNLVKIKTMWLSALHLTSRPTRILFFLLIIFFVLNQLPVKMQLLLVFVTFVWCLVQWTLDWMAYRTTFVLQSICFYCYCCCYYFCINCLLVGCYTTKISVRNFIYYSYFGGEKK